ncbi:hypothetical protein OG946_35135 [Streptomyces sp. NBC_01808]|uniref:MFS transporter n=1 Tax=Streptomyces sp. NBC_01808 TaxID=2975947 RepID=UPI002DD9430E|nr:MFS transporter [Streptomyces sp. NBC_01808]WSA42149.1 hypothetical protein OG946_35135 [Streptomyces sp. NBC_01808]
MLGFSALETGLAFLGPTLAITAGNFLSEKLVHRFGNRASLTGGTLLNAAGAALLARGFRADGSFLTVLAGIVVVGLGMGVTYECMWIAAGTGEAEEEQGLASGVASTALQIGTATGIAVLVAVANRGVDGRAGQALREATAAGMRDATFVLAVALLPAVLAALALPRGKARLVAAGAPESREQSEEEAARGAGQVS